MCIRDRLIPFAESIHSDRILRENNEKMRQEFTANVSHELKTPLTSISGYAELIETGIAKPEDVPGFAQKIHVEVSRMIQLVNDILQLSSLDNASETGSEPEMETVDLLSVAKECVERQKLNARRAYISLTCLGESALVHGNRPLLDELCQNPVSYTHLIDGIVCTLLQRLQNLAFLCKGLPRGNALRNADGMTAAGLAVAAHEHIVRGIQKQDLIPVSYTHLIKSEEIFMTIFNVFSLLGGLALFLFGMDIMGKALEKQAGGQLQKILSKLTDNPLKGFFLGLCVTAVIQSSSATTVMVVGFVNSGIMELHQAIGCLLYTSRCV